MASDKARGEYTAEFKFEAVRQVKTGQAISVVSKVLNIPKASLSNWVSLDRGGTLSGAGDKPSAVVTPEQIERDIAKKPRRTSRRTRCEVRLDSPNEKQMASKHCP